MLFPPDVLPTRLTANDSHGNGMHPDVVACFARGKFYSGQPMNEARDIPRVIAPPPLIALATFLLGLALDWSWPLFMLRGIFNFWTRFIIGAVLIALGTATAGFGWRGFVQAGTNVEPWKSALSLVTGSNGRRLDVLIEKKVQSLQASTTCMKTLPPSGGSLPRRFASSLGSPYRN